MLTIPRVFIECWDDIKDRVYRETPALAVEDSFRIAVYRKHETDPFDKGAYVGVVGVSIGDFEMLPRQFDAMHREENQRILSQVRQIVTEEVERCDNEKTA